MKKVTVHVAKTAGFCFGVDRAVKICEKLAGDGKKAVTLGPIIHNSGVVERLRNSGVSAADSLEEAEDDAVVVIRSHGVAPSVYAEIGRRGLTVADATCPYVGAIHDIVKKGAEAGRVVLIAGDKTHPEVIGIAGYCKENGYIFAAEDELQEKIFPETGDKPSIVVAQTTFNLLQYEKCVERAKALYSDIEVYDTICNATVTRQTEAERLSVSCGVCLVIGDMNSSNTRKLFGICQKNARTYAVESADELSASMFRGAVDIGVTAGASTPAPVIEEVLTRMSEIIKEKEGTVNETEEAKVAEQTAAAEPEIEDSAAEEEFDFSKALEDSLRPIHRNQRVIGVVTQVRANEVVVDIGTKHTGIIPAEEVSDDSSQKIEDLVKVGDELNLLVLKTSDQEGIATLSKKKIDSAEGLDTLMIAVDEDAVLDGYVAELVNKGLIAVVNGIRVFVPASQATLRRGESYDNLLRTNVKLKILEINPARRRAIGSIRAVVQDQLNEKRDAFWETVEEGKEYTGTVKSLTSYGAFVDLGGVDGMVHISELSWRRIKNPAEVVSVGEEIPVYVREVDRERKRISLGYRREEDNPWKKLEESYAVGDIFKTAVVSLTKFGVFVRLIPGIDGLVHVSEIAEDHLEKASDILSVGDEVTVKLIDVDYDRKRVSLSMKFEGAPVLERKPKTEENGETEAKTAEVKVSVEETAAAAKAETVEDVKENSVEEASEQMGETDKE